MDIGSLQLASHPFLPQLCWVYFFIPHSQVLVIVTAVSMMNCELNGKFGGSFECTCLPLAWRIFFNHSMLYQEHWLSANQSRSFAFTFWQEGKRGVVVPLAS
jgi:hypothetical protein